MESSFTESEDSEEDLDDGMDFEEEQPMTVIYVNSSVSLSPGQLCTAVAKATARLAIKVQCGNNMLSALFVLWVIII